MKNLIISLVFIFSLSACEPMFFPPKNQREKDAKAIFDELWQEFNVFYAPFEEREINWSNLYQQYQAQLNENSNEEALYSVLTAMLAKLDDGHVQLNAPRREVFYANRIYREKIDYNLFNRNLIQSKYLKNQFEESAGTEAIEKSFKGLIDNEIVYIHFAKVADEWQWIAELKAQHPQAKGLVLDLRHNVGGDFTYALAAIAHLNTQKRFVFKSRTKNGPNQNDFTDWYNWYVESKGNGFERPIIVLIDRFTISAGERAVMALKTLPNVKLIGVSTNGAISTMMPRQLSNGWNYSIPTQDVLDAEGNVWEGKGIPPQIVLQNTLTDIEQNKDLVLEKAIAEIQKN
ncbi:MAG: S41 family peptidase [Microscillaceae bacterium]|jgi:C-terminal processing protease CtpA/Prc|nr:S41 family peptidase [Microscillaceae bacterium]